MWDLFRRHILNASKKIKIERKQSGRPNRDEKGNIGFDYELIYQTIEAIFDKDWYYFSNQDVLHAKMDPVKHYILHGADEGRQPLAAFDGEWYLRNSPEVLHSGLNPLFHYLTKGATHGISPHPLFDPAWYGSQSDAFSIHSNPLIDYLLHERNWSRSPHPLFDSRWYLERNPDIAAHNVNPFQHFLQFGGLEGRDPCPLFCTRWYLERHPELIAMRRNPLVDYVDRTNFGDRDPNPLFISEWYLQLNGDVASTGINPLVHYVTTGWREGRDPSPCFDAAWYRARYPEIDTQKVEPLSHYLAMGGKESGYLTRPVDRLTNDCDALDIPFEIYRAPGALAGREVCIFVAYAADGHVEEYVVAHLNALKRQGLAIILIIATEGMNHPVPQQLDFVDGILVRLNHGWDFAAWATALAAFPDVWTARLAVLVNDSVYGPVNTAALETVLDRCRRSDKDLVALTDSHQMQHHVMSYFTALTASGLHKKGIREFWNGVRSNRDKDTVIREYEIRSIERWNQSDVSWEVLFPTAAPSASSVEPPINPTLGGWRDLIKRGSPYIKVQLLRDFADTIDAKDWEQAFAGGPELIPLVKADLDRRRAKVAAQPRPVPSPKQRYFQPEVMTTFYGATTSVRPSEEVDLALEVPFRTAGAGEPTLPNKVAVFAHVFYTDLAPGLLAALRNVPVRADLFVSTDTEDKKATILDICRDYANGSIEVRVMPNIGRDIAPMLVGFRDVFDSYEILLHVHSKKSPHDGAFAGWRNFLIDNLLGSPEVVGSIIHLLTASDVGVVFSQHFRPVRHLLNFGYNYETMRSLLARCGVTLSKDLVLEFPSSSFFWARSAALKPLLALGLDWSDFPAEAGQVDGTLAHAIERSLLYVAESAGFRWAKVAQIGRVPFETLVPVQGLGEVEEGLARVHRPLLRNRVVPHKEAPLVSELNRIFARRDLCTRSRLTVLVPTLQPSKTFGGLITALRFFHDLGAHLGPEVDLRIVSISERIDLLSMLALPEYRLLPISAIRDRFPRIVLDASERQRGTMSVRRNEMFVATAWWTAASAYALQNDQEALHGRRLPVLYLIQDHEPNFYPWSARYGEAQLTYCRGSEMIAVLNSEELANALVRRYGLDDARVLPFTLNPIIEKALSQRPRERIILVYGRPTVDRNCFPLLCRGLGLWQRSDPVEAGRWRIVSLGEQFDPRIVSQVRNLEVRGKVSLDDYAELLSTAAVGISLMLSHHPSYPPLEMAYAGICTITNAYEGKDLARRSPNIVSLPSLDAQALATALADSVRKAEKMIGRIVPIAPLSSIPCEVRTYDAAETAARVRELWR